jgi:hypothetical protein
MADTQQADRSGVTAAEAVGALFARPPHDVVRLADELISIAQHLGSLELEAVVTGASRAVVVRGEPSVALPGGGPARLFRPILARLAVLGADETGTACDPYRAAFALVRSARGGPVRLAVELTNTPAVQRVAITRTELAVGNAGAPAPASPPAPATASA